MTRFLAPWAILIILAGVEIILAMPANGNMLGKLLQFGYIRERRETNRGENPTPEEITEGLIKFQRFNGLEETGTYNKETEKLLNAPRCGNKDISYEDGPVDFAAMRRWDKRELTWNLVMFSQTQRLSHEQQINAIQRGLEHWSKVSNLTFRKVAGIADIMISFQKNSHGDGSPFDGPNGVLAHAFFPGRRALNGDTHFDDAELWTDATHEGTNLEIVAAHEFGHALGLGHSSVRDALMAPYYRGYIPNFQLHPDDIAGIQSLYGVRRVPSTTEEPMITTEEPEVTTEVSTTENVFMTSLPLTTEKRIKITQSASTTGKTISTEVPSTSTIKNVPFSLCKRPVDSKIQAIFTDPKGDVYIFLDTGMVISNLTGLRKISELFPNGPKFVDAAAFSNENQLLFLFRGSYMWIYAFNVTTKTFSKNLMKKMDINVTAATVMTGPYGWERVFLFTGQYMYEYHQYFLSVSEKISVGLMWFGCPSNFDAVISNDKEINFIHGNKYTTVDRRYNVVISVPKSIDVLFKCH